MRSETREQYNERLRTYMANRRESRRNELRTMLGDKCVICSSTDDLEFDHIDPSSKSFQISGRGLDKPLPVLMSEAQKCQLLCRSCHSAKTQQENKSRIPWNKGERNANDFGEHGVASTYSEHGCRCALCVTAKRLYRQKHILYNEKI